MFLALRGDGSGCDGAVGVTRAQPRGLLSPREAGAGWDAQPSGIPGAVGEHRPTGPTGRAPGGTSGSILKENGSRYPRGV